MPRSSKAMGTPAASAAFCGTTRYACPDTGGRRMQAKSAGSVKRRAAPRASASAAPPAATVCTVTGELATAPRFTRKSSERVGTHAGTCTVSCVVLAVSTRPRRPPKRTPFSSATALKLLPVTVTVWPAAAVEGETAVTTGVRTTWARKVGACPTIRSVRASTRTVPTCEPRRSMVEAMPSSSVVEDVAVREAPVPSTMRHSTRTSSTGVSLTELTTTT